VCEAWVSRAEARAVEMLADETFREARSAVRSDGDDGREGVVGSDVYGFELAG
jgi:hypothetical protein